jgi:hypothetical protein
MSSEAPERPLPLPHERRPQEGRHHNRLFIVAVAAFAFGVMLHAWIVMSILEDGSGESQPADVPAATDTEAPAEAAAPPDRGSCIEIRGTDYRSQSEREFYLANCLTTTGLARSTVPVRPYQATLRPLPAPGTFGLPTSHRP